jgi:hypothetical protein
MGNSTFHGIINGNAINVAGDLGMDHAKFLGDVLLNRASINGRFDAQTSTFLNRVSGEALSVGGNLDIGSQAAFGGEVDLVGAKVAGILNARGASAALMNFSGVVAQELLVSGLGWWCLGGTPPVGATISGPPSSLTTPTHWRLGDPSWRKARCDGDLATSPMLILRNAHVDAFQDSADAWPPFLDLEGFRYDRLGGVFGGIDSGRNDMRQRSAEEWVDWLSRDRTFSTQPYTQLSSVFAAGGHRATADDIQIAGRERERCEAWKQGRPGSWLWQTILSGAVGYGIGLYTFRVLWWIGGLTVLGAVVLWNSPNARARWYPPHRRPFGIFCLLAASLHRLLPIVTLSKEFQEFFDNPPANPPNLKPWQVAYFAGHALFGWAFGLILLAAMSGLTQNR